MKVKYDENDIIQSKNPILEKINQSNSPYTRKSPDFDYIMSDVGYFINPGKVANKILKLATKESSPSKKPIL